MIEALLRIALFLSVVLSLVGCASPGVSARTTSGIASSVELYATVDDAIRSAVAALTEKRLGDPIIERKENGAVVAGSLSGLAGAVYNSHGGTGRVTITAPFLGSTRLTISATTKSRLEFEPVGSMDSLKGYNYNDPKYAAEIVQRVREILPQSDVARLRAEDDKARLAWEAGIEADRAREAALLAEAAAGSKVTCMNEAECRKAFQLAQIFVSTKSDMKIQLATDTIIETYNPTESYRLGAKVIKTPGAGQSAEIVLSVNCKDCSEPMRKLQLMLMTEFRPWVESRLRQ